MPAFSQRSFNPRFQTELKEGKQLVRAWDRVVHKGHTYHLLRYPAQILHIANKYPMLYVRLAHERLNWKDTRSLRRGAGNPWGNRPHIQYYQRHKSQFLRPVVSYKERTNHKIIGGQIIYESPTSIANSNSQVSLPSRTGLQHQVSSFHCHYTTETRNRIIASGLSQCGCT